MPRLLLLALGLTVALAGCDTYGVDGTPDPDPVDPNPPPTDSTEVPVPNENTDLATALGCPTVATATMGARGGSLVSTDCTLEAGRFPEYDGGEYLDAYAFTLTDTTAVTLDLDANAFDPVLALMNEDLEVIAFNDDRGPGTPADDEGSTIAATLAPGRYVAVATSFFPGEQGTYTLRMAEE